MYEYKTVEASFRYIEERINEVAKDDWRVVGICPGSVTGKEATILALLERKRPSPK
jgi:hypothetical protein